MRCREEFDGWSSLTVENLLIAYRKAKADCFFEETFPTAIKFAEYEQDLLTNLRNLLKRLQGKLDFKSDKELRGDFRLIPKKLATDKKLDSCQNGHVHFSKPERAFENLLKTHDITPEFRIVGDFPVDTHIISALWINMIGHKFDAKLDDCCYGARLKRIERDLLSTEDDAGLFDISSIGSFKRYFRPYQKWRRDGLGAIRDELERDRDVIAITLDLTSYYHLIDPLVISSPGLHEELGLKLSDEEKTFTKQLADFLKSWADDASTFSQSIGEGGAKINGGLVIGLTCSRIISNVLLHKWDRLVLEKLSPIHYGRYVDDMFLVLRDSGTITNSLDLMLLIQERMGESCIFQSTGDNEAWEINQGTDIQGESRITLQRGKQKLFVLQGRAGLDLLDSIEKEMYELSSEHRLMPSPDQLEGSAAAKVLSAAGSVDENGGALRRTDGLTICRLSWALQLRHVEILARDLPPNRWKEQREEFYQFAQNHIVRADHLFAYFKYLPRLLGFAVGMNEWTHARRIAINAYRALDTLASYAQNETNCRINECEAKSSEELWSYVRDTLTWFFIDAAARYHNPAGLELSEPADKTKHLANRFYDYIVDKLTKVEDLFELQFDVEGFQTKASLVASADLGKEAYKYILKGPAAAKLVDKPNKIEEEKEKEKEILALLDIGGLIDEKVFERFIECTRDLRLDKVMQEQRSNESYLPYLFPTRPLSPAEISELAPECVGLSPAAKEDSTYSPAEIWAKYTQVLGGTVTNQTVFSAQQDTKDSASKQCKNCLRIGTGRKNKIVVALTSFLMEDSDWKATAYNEPNLSRERYQKLSELVNAVLSLNPRPDYVLFPELSIPLRWLDSIAAKFRAVGISLIAGTEYRHSESNMVQSQAVLILTDNRLGYPTFVKIWQPKLEPAVGEDEDLTVKFGKEWDTSKKSVKPIYRHNGVNFGVMVCSELQNSKARIRFQGAVDALMVLSWNRDLDTFASLVESAALDVHAYTILVNNRKYGDSRVRSPAKESFRRDIARLRGGDNDFVVAATLDIDALRAFQSRAKRWPQEGDKFKPVPEGFDLCGCRRQVPS